MTPVGIGPQYIHIKYFYYAKILRRFKLGSAPNKRVKQFLIDKQFQLYTVGLVHWEAMEDKQVEF